MTIKAISTNSRIFFFKIEKLQISAKIWTFNKGEFETRIDDPNAEADFTSALKRGDPFFNLTDYQTPQ